jgi:8-oxo-dGTP diphosphatase
VGADRATVIAAGAVIWRSRPGGAVEVLLVHSTKQNEWSWPKGKVAAGETLPECAVREAAEETGLTPVLGQPLPDVVYRLADGRDKRVSFWAAQVAPAVGGGRDPTEIDGNQWVSPEHARRMLPHSGHHAPLDALLERVRQECADTRAMVVVRHAEALHRHEWNGPDPERPLTAGGWREAAALVRLLACWQPTRLVSSPSTRCMQTVTGFAEAVGLPLHADPVLSEEGAELAPAAVEAWVRTLFTGRETSLVCTHRPVLGVMMRELSGHVSDAVAHDLPDQDPYLQPAQMLVVHIARPGGRPQVPTIELHSPSTSG